MILWLVPTFLINKLKAYRIILTFANVNEFSNFYLITAAKFRCNVSTRSLKETQHLLKGKLSKKHLSKSASELQHQGERKGLHRTVTTDKRGGWSESSPKHQQHHRAGMPPDSLAKHATVVQKTQAFFASLKVRCRGNRLLFPFISQHLSRPKSRA